jgi:hypothetical protein
MVAVGANSNNLELHLSDFEQTQYTSTTIASMDSEFQKRSNISLSYSPTVVNENEDYSNNPSLDLESINFTLTDHTQFLPQATTLGFDISGNENSADVINEVSTRSIVENEGDFLTDWNLTRPSLKTVDETRTASLLQADLPSGVGTTLVLENLDSETRDEVLNVLFKHRRRIAFRIE